MPKLSDQQVANLNLRLLQDSAEYLAREIIPQRERNRRYYDGKTPDGLNDVEGRSSIVDNIVRDTVETILPSLIRIFNSGDKLISIEGQGEEDVEKAERVEGWVNYVEGRQNPGFLNDYSWFKDALIAKDGWEKVYWTSVERVYREDYEAISKEALAELEADEDYEVLSKEPVKALVMDPLVGAPVEVDGWSVTGNKIEAEWQQRIEVLHPDSVLFPEGQTADRATWWFVSHKSQKRISELREAGLKVDDDISGPELDASNYETIDEIEDFRDDDDSELAGIDPSLRQVWVYESFIKADVDGDGIAEWNKVIQVGDMILELEQEPEPNMFHISPVIRTHQLGGDAVIDLVYDLQELMTALNRQVLDNVYLTNNPRAELVQGGMTQHTWNDYHNNAAGAPVRVKAAGTINPIVTGQLQPWTFSLLEYWEGKRENRAGVTRYNQGLDANSLNKTATGVMQIFQAAMQRIELIARVFAETGVKDKIRYIIDSSARYPEYVDSRSIRLQGRKLDITSKDIQGRYDLVINPAIGTGNKQQTLQNVTLLMNFYQQAAAAGLGPGSEQALYSINNLFNATREMIKAMGWRNTSDFLIDPMGEGAESLRDPVRPPQPNPDMVKAQTEQAKVQGDLQSKQEEIKAKREYDMGKLQVERERVALERERLQLEQAKLGQDLAIAQRQPDKAGRDNVVDIEDRIAERELKERELLMREREIDARIAAMARDGRREESSSRDDQSIDRIEQMVGQVLQVTAGPKVFERDAFGQVVAINGAPVLRDANGLVLGIGQQEEASNAN